MRLKMSKLQDLINKLCPNGVEYKYIKDTFKRLKGTPITAGKMKEIENVDGEIRIFAGGKTIINAKEEDIPKANITRVPAVLVQSRGIIDFIYYEKPFTFKNEMWAYTTEDKVSVKFLYYVLKNNLSYFRDASSGMGSMPQISLRITEDFMIPVPPLEVQREIVRILDSFTKYTTELITNLITEIEVQKKQYEYYQDLVLTFVETGNTILSEQSRAEQSRAEQSRAEQSRAEQSRAEQSRAEQSRAEQSRAEQE
jgi:type I restriction enzyme S subunit